MSENTGVTTTPQVSAPGSPSRLEAPTSVAHKSPSHVELVNAVPRSSPPVPSQDATASNAPVQSSQQSESNTNGAEDANDSEAETLISSPVKKREMLKIAIEEELKNGVDGADRAIMQNIPELAPVHDEEKVGSVTASASNADVEKAQTAEDAEAQDATAMDEDDESDKLSDISERSSAASLGSHPDSEGSEMDAEFDGMDAGDDPHAGGDDGGDNAKEENKRTLNPRKRKHTDSSMQINMEPPRRRRRASDLGNARSRHRETAIQISGEAMTSPQLRRHRRTISTQSGWTDPQRNNGDSELGSNAGRQRRAATHFPMQEVKARKSTWDSDNSSDASHQHHKSRLTRGLGRSVSTPGRPMGRDHKRHVNKYGFTRLAEACENGDLDQVKEWHIKDPGQLEHPDNAGNSPLQVASLNGHADIVSYLLKHGANRDCTNRDEDTPLIDAVENGEIECARLLLNAGVNPVRQNLKGQQALDVVTDDTENSAEIRALLLDAVENWTRDQTGEQQRRGEPPANRPGPTKGLQFMARTYENLMKLVSDNDRSGVQEFLDARVPVDNAIVAAAAKTGDTFTVNMLLAEMNPKKARQRPEKPMLAVIGTSHFEMLKFLTGVDQFNPTWRSKSNGMTWFELAEHRRGPKWRQEKELLKALYDEQVSAERLSSSPVHRRENGKKRRQSPDRSKDSDVDMEDVDSPDQARSRRRLVSKKVMRASSNRRASSSSSDVPTNADNSAMNSSDSDVVRPPVPRKVGRPRKISTVSRFSEPRMKRRRSSSSKDNVIVTAPSREATMPDVPTEDVSADARPEIKIEEADRQKAEEDQKARLKEQAEDTERLEADNLAEKNRLAEESRLAEETRIADEARVTEATRKKEQEDSKRKEVERKAEEMRLKHEQRMAEERRIRTEAQLSALPSALRHVLGLVDSEKHDYIRRHFLPIQVVKSNQLGLPAGNDSKGDDLWMLNYQAAAILTGDSASSLLDMTGSTPSKSLPLAGIQRRPVTESQAKLMLPCLQRSALVHQLTEDDDNDEDDLAAEIAALERTRARVQEDRSKFLSLSPLSWIRFDDFEAAVAASGAPHLEGLALDVRFDCCLDASSFATDIPDQHIHNVSSTAVNGSRLPDSGIFMDGANDAPAGSGVTILTLVQD